MTSSLVGSEMCIRDSVSCLRPQAEASATHHGVPQSSGQLGQYQHDVPAVSYTHLTLPTICSV
eukprot:9271274-Prorocentrum_lima.AAC.1